MPSKRTYSGVIKGRDAAIARGKASDLAQERIALEKKRTSNKIKIDPSLLRSDPFGVGMSLGALIELGKNYAKSRERSRINKKRNASK